MNVSRDGRVRQVLERAMVNVMGRKRQDRSTDSGVPESLVVMESCILPHVILNRKGML